MDENVRKILEGMGIFGPAQPVPASEPAVPAVAPAGRAASDAADAWAMLGGMGIGGPAPAPEPVSGPAAPSAGISDAGRAWAMVEGLGISAGTVPVPAQAAPVQPQPCGPEWGLLKNLGWLTGTLPMPQQADDACLEPEEDVSGAAAVPEPAAGCPASLLEPDEESMSVSGPDAAPDGSHGPGDGEQPLPSVPDAGPDGDEARGGDDVPDGSHGAGEPVPASVAGPDGDAAPDAAVGGFAADDARPSDSPDGPVRPAVPRTGAYVADLDGSILRGVQWADGMAMGHGAAFGAAAGEAYDWHELLHGVPEGGLAAVERRIGELCDPSACRHPLLAREGGYVRLTPFGSAVSSDRLSAFLANGSYDPASGTWAMPPHDLDGLFAAMRIVLGSGGHADADAVLDALGGPDFPWGGCLSDGSWRDAYKSGRGTVAVEPAARLASGPDGQSLVLSGFPDGLAPGAAADAVRACAGSLGLPVDSVDAGPNGVTVSMPAHADPEEVLSALLDGAGLRTAVPVDMSPYGSFLEALEEYVAHAVAAVLDMGMLRRSEFVGTRRALDAKALAGSRAKELLDVALSGDDLASYLTGRLGMSAEQAAAVRACTLEDFSGDSLSALPGKLAVAHREIELCDRFISDPGAAPARLLSAWKSAAKASGGRRTARAPDSGRLFGDGPVLVALSSDGVLSRACGAVAGGPASGAPAGFAAAQSPSSDVLLFTDQGRMCRVRAGRVPPAGVPAGDLVPGLRPGESVSCAAVPDGDPGRGFIAVCTAGGMAKRLAVGDAVRGSWTQAIRLEPGDAVRGAVYADGDDELLFVTASGSCAAFRADLVRPMGREARGVRAVRLEDGDRVASVSVRRPLEPSGMVVVTSRGYAKITAMAEFAATKGRDVSGVACVKQGDEKAGPVAAMAPLRGDGDGLELAVLLADGSVRRVPLADLPVRGRTARGRAVLGGDCPDVAGAALVPAPAEEPFDPVEADVFNPGSGLYDGGASLAVPGADEEAASDDLAWYEAGFLGSEDGRVPDETLEDASVTVSADGLAEFARTVELDDHGNPILDNSWM